MNICRKYSLIALVLFLWSCNVTKHVPDGEYLLNDYQIHSDVKSIKQNELDNYLRQTPNEKAFGLFRMQLGIYNWAGKDTTSRWNRSLMRMGDAPVIYKENLTRMSAQQLQKVFINKGYINTEVTTELKLKGKKASVDYYVNSQKPFKLNAYEAELENPLLSALANDSSRTLIKPGMLFDVDVLNEERERLSDRVRNQGLYYFNKDFLVYTADSTQNSHEIDLKLDFRDYIMLENDSINQAIFKSFNVGKVFYYSNTNVNFAYDMQNVENLDTTRYKDFYLISPKKQFVNLEALIHNTYIEPNTLYTDRAVERTYSALNSLPPIKYVDISFKEQADSTLDCYIIIVPAKTISLSVDLEGTYTDGFWGVGTSVSTVNKNTFNGAESLSAQVKAAFEWQNGIWARDLGAQIGLKLPRFVFPVGSFDFKRNIHANTEFHTNLLHQFRPGEFTSTNLSGGMKYFWNKNRYRHNLDLLSLSYVYFPEISTAFEETFINTGLYNRYNYDDHFIMRTGYSGSYSNFIPNRPMRNYHSFRYNLETAGNLLYGLNELFDSKRDADGFYKLLNIRYAQYVRGEFNLSSHQIIDYNNRFVYHFGLGVGIPYGNADIIPFERRFYSGGANSVRGWSESRLGPGVYQENLLAPTRDFNQVGDIKLDMNMEYRVKLFYLLEGALFLDAGNIWTIHDYPEQPGGAFKFDSFMNQIAIAYGAGIRLDFSFFVARFDFGMKLYNPVLPRLEKWRIHPTSNDFAFHIAIGYPF